MRPLQFNLFGGSIQALFHWKSVMSLFPAGQSLVWQRASEWSTVSDSQVQGQDWTYQPLAGLAGLFDHLVKGEREEAVRVWYGNAEQ